MIPENVQSKHFTRIGHNMKRFEYKKVIGFTLQQKRAFEILEEHGVNVNNFIRQAISEKIKSDWRKIKEPTTKEYCPF